ncbi:MAG: Aldehyde dehydrogenase [uncultured Solirubrobacteraceae bacterium]|uniref:Aldehyde dehydrogenase n=1 Tax=uncultured Solirubrobacteraceae bacterium TaxID=1162706 RepID=A0A6J4SKK6_9ACTN|nr:MAG: Aldehyde dehydrogenase [uncultured Solirubrobacteraceae bacterium]
MTVTPSAPQRFALPIGDSMVAGGGWAAVTDKYRGEPAYEVALAAADDVDDAVAAARAAAAATLPAHRRYEILMAAAQGIATARDTLVETLITEAGKPRKASVNEVRRTIETFQWSAEEAKRVGGEAMPLDGTPDGEGRYAITLRQPVGVVVAITPANSPLNLVAHKVAPAIAAGNAVVLKPPQATPVCSLILHRILAAAGLPPGYLNVLVGPEVGEALLAHPGVDFYNFTGSEGVGEHLRRTVGLRDSILELGGNSPVLVHADADIARAAAACAGKGFLAAGQACTSVQRIHVHRDVYAGFVEALRAAAERLVVGDPRDPRTDVGPMISEREADRVESWVQDALAAGATRATGGRRDGALLWPTVLENVPRSASVYCSEVFGPVVVVEPYDDLEAAIDAANSTRYGLHSAVFTASLDVAFHVIERLEAGGVVVNDASQWRTEFVPFGGVKRSGIGREGPRYAIDRMSRLKVAMFALRPPA